MWGWGGRGEDPCIWLHGDGAAAKFGIRLPGPSAWGCISPWLLRAPWLKGRHIKVTRSPAPSCSPHPHHASAPCRGWVWCGCFPGLRLFFLHPAALIYGISCITVAALSSLLGGGVLQVSFLLPPQMVPCPRVLVRYPQALSLGPVQHPLHWVPIAPAHFT